MNSGIPFDLNIEKILENWNVYHAIREIIANALDEEMLSNSKKIEIYKDINKQNTWHIRDYGRGLRHTYLTQNENKEKINHPGLIGQFGIGLKDALATFNRKKINVKIISRYLIIDKIDMHKKMGFDDVYTLNAWIQEPEDTKFIGTEFILSGIKDAEMTEAKNLFLIFLDCEILESTEYGQVIKETKKGGNIFLNGIKVATEENFLFSYNITSLDKKIKKALNRERTNVGRNAYSDRIKTILKACKSEKVLELLGNELQKIKDVTSCDESSWVDIQEHVVKYLNLAKKYIFISFSEMVQFGGIIDEIRSSDKKIILIPDNLQLKLRNITDFDGNNINNMDQYIHERENNFVYEFVDINQLSENELKIFNKTDDIIKLLGTKPIKIKSIKISEVMQKDVITFLPALGVWDENTGEIIIKRSELRNLKNYSSTLLHELIHTKTGAEDISREFEEGLTNALGLLANKII